MSLTAPIAPRPPATRIAVTSGKGGVGKTSLTINLAVAMARLGHRVGVLDADFALGNIDVLLGLTPHEHLGAVLDGTTTIGAITLAGPSGLRIIPAGSGVRGLTAIDDVRWVRLGAAIEEAGRDLDFLLFDTATGIGDNVLNVIELADYALVITSFEPAAVVDAYAIIKLLTALNPAKPIGVVVNTARDAEEGQIVFRQISSASERFLNRTLRYDGHVLEDRSVKDATLGQMPLMGSESKSPATRDIRRLACRLTAARSAGAGPWPSHQLPIGAPAGPAVGDARCA
ncbi:MAG: P-loop NTPase [Vicinamibacterales bacterium]